MMTDLLDPQVEYAIALGMLAVVFAFTVAAVVRRSRELDAIAALVRTAGDDVVHSAPRPGSRTVPCCGRHISELPHTFRVASDARLVTCPRALVIPCHITPADGERIAREWEQLRLDTLRESVIADLDARSEAR